MSDREVKECKSARVEEVPIAIERGVVLSR